MDRLVPTLKHEMRSYLRAGILRLRGELGQDELRRRGLRLGRGVFIGERSRFDSGFMHLISVGDGATISSDVTVLAHDAATKIELGYSKIAPVTIGSEAYIGAGAIRFPA